MVVFRKGIRTFGILLALCCAIGLATMEGAQAAGSKPGKYGKKLVAAYDLPVEALAEIARFVPKNTSNPSTIYGDTKDWTGAELSLLTGGNPYTLVFKVSGVAVDGGDATAYFRPGWSLDGVKRIGLVVPVTKPAAKAGDVVQKEVVLAPISVKEDKPAAPYLGFSGANNITITAVSVEVWSGMASTSWPALLMAWAPMLGGLAALGFMFWWFRR